MSTQELEAALETARKREEVALELAREQYNECQRLRKLNSRLEERIRELELPKGRKEEDQSWVDRIAIIIGRATRPLRSREIMSELQAMDEDGLMDTLFSPAKSLSVALRRAVETGRLKQFKVPGTRGSYYALLKWVDKNGKLSKAMRDEMW